MHTSVLLFARRMLTDELVQGQDVLEVGSRNVNGSVRGLCEWLGCSTYLGVDVLAGPGVDRVVPAVGLYEELRLLRPQGWGVVICTEVLEHAEHWQELVSDIKRLCAAGGSVLLTCRGPGFWRHEPPDFWRFTVEDIGQAFRDCELVELVADDQPIHPGVLMLARKPEDWVEADISQMVVEEAPHGES